MRKITNQELKDILTQHELWAATDGQQGKKADLSGTNLTDQSFINVDLRGAIFIDAYLGRASFFRCDVRGIDFTRAYLRTAYGVDQSFSDANLEDADLTESQLKNINNKG